MRQSGDFTHWTHHDDDQKALKRLLRALKAEVEKAEQQEGLKEQRKT
jgi:predicted class III extradiol MEMO1 family dioxygenase